MSLFDRLLGRTQMAAAPAKAEISGLMSDQAVDAFAEMLIRLPDPDEILVQAGLTRVDLRPLAADDEIATALDTRLAAVQATPWRLEPGEGAATEFVWGELDKHIEQIIGASFQALPYGYSAAERVYIKDGARTRLSHVTEKPFEWFQPQRDGTLRYFSPTASAEGEIVDTRYKFLLTVRRPTYRLPMGQALLSHLYWPWFMRSNGWRFWARFLERFGSPLLLGKTDGDKSALANVLASAVQAAAVAVSNDEDVTAVTAGTDGGAFDKFHTAVDKRIQKVILGQTLTTDTQGVGSQALGNVHDLVRQDRRFADVRMIMPVLQNVVDALVALNFPGATPPVFVMEDGTGLGADRADRDSKLVTSGIVRLTEQYILDRYDFEPGDFEIVAPAAQPIPGAQASIKPGATTFASARFTPGQNAIEDLVEASSESSPQPIPPGVLRRLIEAASTPEELIDSLAAAVDDNLATSEFRSLVERSLFAADLMGYAQADDESRT